MIMKDILQNEILSSYGIGERRVLTQRNRVSRRIVSKNWEESLSIQHKTLRQTNLTNLINTEESSSGLRNRVGLGLISRHRQQFHKTLQDNAGFILELEALKQSYKFCEENFVSSFLRKNRFLIPLLREIPEKLYDYFGKNQKLALKVSFESDSPQLSELWILILTELPTTEAFPILEKFDEEWWLENLDRTDCKLNISLEYI
jgi:hypothetical protein